MTSHTTNVSMATSLFENFYISRDWHITHDLNRITFFTIPFRFLQKCHDRLTACRPVRQRSRESHAIYKIDPVRFALYLYRDIYCEANDMEKFQKAYMILGSARTMPNKQEEHWQLIHKQLYHMKLWAPLFIHLCHHSHIFVKVQM